MISAQDTSKLIYNPAADANTDLNAAINKAKTDGKHVFVQVGGNWCTWCHRFHRFSTTDRVIDSLMNAYYVIVRVNYSKEVKNQDVLQRLEFPQRFGFPVFVILDSNGSRLHTQDSGYLEKDKSYDRKKVIKFLQSWSVAALDPNKYSGK